MFTTSCPNCESSLNAPDSLKGRRVKCKKCGEPFVARPADAHKGALRPSPDDDPTEEVSIANSEERQPIDEADDTEVMEAPIIDDEDDEPDPKRRRNKKNGSPIMMFVLVGIGAILLLGGGGVGAYFAFFNDEKKPDPAQANGGTPPGGTLDGSAPSAGWVECPEPRGNYRVKFPEVPVTRILPHEGPGGENFDLVVNLWESDAEWFLAAHKPVPDLKTKGLTTDYALDEGFSIKRFRFRKAVETSRQPMTYQGHPGRELVLDFPENGMRGVGRLILAKNRMLIMIVAAKELSPDSPRARAFFESLKIE